MLQHLTSQKLEVTKKTRLPSDVMFVTNNDIYKEYYLIFLMYYFREEYVYCAFLMEIMSSFVSISHSRVSPFFSSNKSLANTGTVVVKEPATCCTFVLYFNFISPSLFILFINNIRYVNISIYSYLYRNLYILGSSTIIQGSEIRSCNSEENFSKKIQVM